MTVKLVLPDNRAMNKAATQIIDSLGGTAEVSRMFGVRMPSVSDWKKTGIPKARMMFLEVAHKKALSCIDVAAATAVSRSAGTTATPAKEAANG